MKGKQTDEIKNVIQEAQLKIAQIMFAQVQPEKGFEFNNLLISDLVSFGEANHSQDAAFRWPSQ